MNGGTLLRVAAWLALSGILPAADPAPPSRIMAFGIGQDRIPSMARNTALGQARSQLATQLFGKGFTWSRAEGRVKVLPGADGNLEHLKTERYLGLGQGKVLVLVSLRPAPPLAPGGRAFLLEVEAEGRDGGEAFESALQQRLGHLLGTNLPGVRQCRGRCYLGALKAEALRPAGRWRMSGQAWVCIDQQD